ncbi:tRNA (N6-threonylcarbamoyladenosine(37)-N6)-methyltransferase TrmO [Methylocella sp. CPCC 101449]|uniref:tRNA (N6-threonylcarbamoyladenosine(37)-N6)-methyltransferase TrmO n=1 Tax=Methylocella sp. CPCC 101449 TaxID=2987531 RepID=UPI0028919BB1|nr:tRNA (N6-threonylcarbamoyladenosine(37)-N6)-methyltransferase TrmO [Methylocella sp. CPCC 101449]MDT2019517.1 tRNA (N6-threonylcarbamoyladenosine(37)-N6)-methyltransferase TrmO [Methylocella sp. CPCC 101449]
MPTTTEIRAGERLGQLPDRGDETLFFIGTIRTPWPSRRDCPRKGDLDGPPCRIEVDPRWQDALADIAGHEYLQILYWMHEARRDLLQQSPRSNGQATGTFALRSPNRPNPIASSLVVLEKVEGNVLTVRGLDCIDGTPLIDIKPDTCPHWLGQEAGQDQKKAEET